MVTRSVRPCIGYRPVWGTNAFSFSESNYKMVNKDIKNKRERSIMTDTSKLHFETKQVHAGQVVDETCLL